MPLEIACFNNVSALRAASSGADRIELCADPSVGGTTPSLSDFLSLKQNPDVTLPVNVMIRPRGGDFVYTEEEFETIERDLELFQQHGADGFVFGILTGEKEIDVERCKVLLAKANGNPCTFHRAFDAIAPSSMLSQLEKLVALGFASVLTSGGAPNAVQGKEMLKRLVEGAKGRISIIVGGGVRAANLRDMRGHVGTEWWHSSAVVDGSDVASELEIRLLGKALRV